MNTGLIYRITSPSGKSYIGQTTQDFDERMKQHQNLKGCNAIHNAIKKYGFHNMEVSILARNMTEYQLNKEEINLIKIYNTLSPHGYNLTTGGEGGSPSDETRAKMSAINSARGDNHSSKRLEVRAKMSAAQLGKSNTKQHRRNISIAKKGKKIQRWTEERKAARRLQIAQRKHENKVNMSLTQQLHRYEKKLEKEGLL